MNKAILSMAGIAALALSSAGMAAYGNTTEAVNTEATTNATTASGFYISGNLGYGQTSINQTDFANNVVLTYYAGKYNVTRFDRSGLIWNADLGYQFNPYFAVEAGYTRYANVKASGANVFTPSLTGSSTGKLDAFDLALKGIYPVNAQFDIFGKLGAAWMHYRQTLNCGTLPSCSPLSVKSDNLTPLLGLGVDYYVTDNLAVTAQGVYTFQQSKKTTVDTKYETLKTTNTIPATYLGMVGLTYKFTV